MTFAIRNIYDLQLTIQQVKEWEKWPTSKNNNDDGPNKLLTPPAGLGLEVVRDISGMVVQWNKKDVVAVVRSQGG